MSAIDVTSAPTLSAHALHLWRGEHHLLRNISFCLSAGELLQISGSNGVGKTSLLRVVAGLLPAEAGEIRWRRFDIYKDSNYHSELAYLGHSNALKLDLTALENLQFAAGLRRDINLQTCLQILNNLGVPQCAQLPAKVLSAGQRRRVALARVLLCDAVLWIVDEPTTNLDAAGIEVVEQLMVDHLSRGGMILTAAHHALLATHAGTRTMYLNQA